MKSKKTPTYAESLNTAWREGQMLVLHGHDFDRQKEIESQIGKLRLKADEFAQLRHVMIERFSIGGKTARPLMVMEQAVAAMKFVDMLMTRLDAAVWKAQQRDGKRQLRAARKRRSRG